MDEKLQSTKTALIDFDKKIISKKIPEWDELPSIDLYMDQVIVLLNMYLNSDGTNAITQSMINNYVKQKAIPAPVKKKYSKIHLAYLIIFCTLKQTMSISAIQKVIPVNMTESEIIKTYNSFLQSKAEAIKYSSAQIKVFLKVLEDDKNADALNIIAQVANIANTFKSLNETLINFEQENKQ
ncbi:MAG: DUF1836 domain-containing protein [Clostridia bacterium]|nr:DUF1836 domain-containing protein [Clostridia bacterium]